MHRLVVMYPQPEDPEKFREYYETVHSTLGLKVPNVRNMHFSFDVKGFCPVTKAGSSRTSTSFACSWPSGIRKLTCTRR